MKTTRRTNTIKNAGKAISIYSNGSERTDSSDKENSAFNKYNKASELRLETVSTQFSEIDNQKNSKNQVFADSSDVHMSIDIESAFDTLMSECEETVHQKVVSEHGRAIISNLKKSETTMVGDLERHEIKSTHRHQMVVWMEEVLKIFKCPVDTFFMSVQILDRYLELSKKSLKLADLHEIGIVSMFISSKYQEIEPLTIDLMINKISHGKICRKELLKREMDILCTLKFKLGTPNALNFIDSYTEYFSSSFTTDAKNTIREIAVKVAKNGISDRRIAFTVLPSELALCSLIIAIKSHSKACKRQMLTVSLSGDIKNELTSDQSMVLQFGKRLRKLATEAVY